MASSVRGGGTGGYRDVTHILRGTPRPGHLLRVPGASSRGVGRQLASGGPQPTVHYTEVGMDDSGF